jgi:hypothetical protein
MNDNDSSKDDERVIGKLILAGLLDQADVESATGLSDWVSLTADEGAVPLSSELLELRSEERS